MGNFSKFIDLVYETRDKRLLEDLLVGITTEAERREIGNRLVIIQELLKDVPQQDIADNLHVGIATVTRGAKELAQGRFKVLREKQ